MALRLAKSLRWRLPFIPAQTGRIRLTQSDEVVDEVPHTYYVVKDYDRNPWYNDMYYAQRPGFKKDFDHFLKASERRESMWTPQYRLQVYDLGLSWTTMLLVILLPIQLWGIFIWESVGTMQKYLKFRTDPLSSGGQKPVEL